MSLPPRYAWSIYEVSARWGCMPADIVGWAIAGKLELVTSVPFCTTGSKDYVGMAAIRAESLLPMFRRDGSGPRTVTIHHIKNPGDGGDWTRITAPSEGTEVHSADIMITTADIERFEDRHGMINRPVIGRRGRSATWDWDAFWCQLMRRIHNYGLPATQRELTLEMQEWFSRRHPDGDMPDESTIGKKVRQAWKQIHDEAEDADP